MEFGVNGSGTVGRSATGMAMTRAYPTLRRVRHHMLSTALG